MAEHADRKSGRSRREVYEQVIIPDLSDRDLANHSFEVKDPMSLPNLTNEEPPRDQKIYLVGRYSLSNFVQCVFGHLHKNGYAFRDETGRHYLVGGTCGETVMGVEAWHDFAKTYTGLEERSGYLRQMYALQEALRQHGPWLSTLATLPEVRALEAVRSLILKRRELSIAAQTAFLVRDGRLDRRIKVRNLEKEEARETREEVEIERFKKMSEMEQVQYLRNRAEPRISTSKIYDDQLVDAGTLRGKVFFVRGGVNFSNIFDMVAHLHRLSILDTMPEQTNILKKMSVEARAILDNILQIREDVAQAVSFFDPDNLRLLADWANSRGYDRCSYDVAPGALVIHNEKTGKSFNISRPRELNEINDGRFDVLREASRAFGRLLDRGK